MKNLLPLFSSSCVALLLLVAGCMTAPTPRLVAHRGEERYAPEGFIPAYQIAVRDGCDIMKMDVHETKDGVVVMSHDPDVGRTMGWRTNIIDVTYAELKEKGTFKPVGGYANERIVTLREALAYRDELGLFGVNMPVLQGQTTKEDIAFLRRNGLWVSLWFVNNTKMAEKYKGCGADAYVTCDAAACRAVE